MPSFVPSTSMLKSPAGTPKSLLDSVPLNVPSSGGWKPLFGVKRIPAMHVSSQFGRRVTRSSAGVL